MLLDKHTKLYIEIDSARYWENGAIFVTGRVPKTEEMILDTVGMAPKGGFSITREKDLIGCLRKIKGKMGLLLAYIIENRDSHNTIPYDLKEIKETTGLTEQSIIANLKYFERCGIIARKRKTIMLASGVVHRGNRLKEGALNKRFLEMQEWSKKEAEKQDAGKAKAEESDDTE